MKKLQCEFLDALDDLLASGTALLSPEFRTQHADFIKNQQAENGGFRGRSGSPDLYYAEFAVRSLIMLDDPCDLQPVADYLCGVQYWPAGIAHSFSLLNILRMLRKRGVDLGRGVTSRLVSVADGMWERDASITNRFLTTLCVELEGTGQVYDPIAMHFIPQMQRRDGGFSEVRGKRLGQMKATASAIAFLTMARKLTTIDCDAAVAFLQSMQTRTGGLKAHKNAVEADLLSTFTGLITLSALGSLGRMDLAAVARFTRDLASPGGGFRGWPSDTGCDVEFTYYGVATAALLRLHASTRAEENA